MRWSALIAIALASTAAAQQPEAPHEDDAAIVVTGRSGAVTRAYVERVARPEPGVQLARWNAPLCVRFAGLGDQYAAVIKARIVEIATGIGLKMAGPKCPTAVLIKLTDEADALTTDLLHSYPRHIGSVTSRALPSPRLMKALATPRTVRWLTASVTVAADGTAINPEGTRLWMDSLIRSSTREALDSKIILIDANRLDHVSLRQFADYITFVTLASPDLAADFTGTDSIMALFADAGIAPAEMTAQDLAFLEALYAVPPDRSASVQQGAIRARIKRGK